MSGVADGWVRQAGRQEATGAVHRERPATAPVFWRGAPWLALALVAIVVGRFQDVVPGLQVLRPALVGTAAVALILLLGANAETWRLTFSLTATRLLCAYLGWAAVTIPFAYWPGLAFDTARGMVPVTAMFVAIVTCSPTRANLDRVQFGFVVGLAIFAASSLLWGTRVIGRVGGVGAMYDPNDMATVMAVGFPLGAGLIGRTRGIRRLLLLAGILALLASVVASASRGGTVALGVGAVVLAAGQRRSRRMRYLVALGFGALVVWFGAGPVFRERAATLLTLQSDYNVQDVKNGRVAVWKRGVTYFLDHPIVGNGAGNFEVAEGMALAARGEKGRWVSPHDAYIQAFADLGFVGGAVFLSLIGVTWWQARRLWRPPLCGLAASYHRPEFLAALSAFCVGALFLSWAYSALLVGLAGLIALAGNTLRPQRGRLL